MYRCYILYGIKKNDVEIINVNNQECKNMMKEFIEKNPKIWNEDIGIEFINK